MGTNFSHGSGAGDTRMVPEMVEVELYRRSVAPLVGGTLHDVAAPDAWWARRAPDVAALLDGAVLTGARRHGKVLLLDTDGAVLGLRFGMTGRLLVSGASGVDSLAYGASGDDPAWIRFAFAVDGRAVAVSDPRRLGSVEIDPPVDELGPDAWSVDARGLAAVLAGRQAPVKAVLLDQHRIAGLGNMLVDDVLLRAGIHPQRAAHDLTSAEVRRLAGAIPRELDAALAAGGSHRGVLPAEGRREGAPCPLDGAPLTRLVVGGRTTYACCAHQR